MPVGATNHWLVPNFFLQKFPAEQFSVTTKLDISHLAPGDKTGLVVMGMDYSFLAVEKTATGCRLSKVSCRNANTRGKDVEEATAVCAGDLVYLRVKVSPGALCEFSCSSDGKEFTSIDQPFKARPGRWIGAKVGLFCLASGEAPPRGCADFDWFRFE